MVLSSHVLKIHVLGVDRGPREFDPPMLVCSERVKRHVSEVFNSWTTILRALLNTPNLQSGKQHQQGGATAFTRVLLCIDLVLVATQSGHKEQSVRPSPWRARAPGVRGETALSQGLTSRSGTDNWR
ncbi:hypothetical protein RRG08_024801 [Elysia crispata]|uniref:Uncharacterized protein n=1 Tax=Elysia crispata TaxID=231223 RepID=A0AAE0YIW6_9GAST|nr:hypothetical protein RRG08_024801 [Elysia crispata]